MTNEPKMESILDVLGLDNAKLVTLAEGMIGPMIGKEEPVLVAWVNNNAPRIVKSLMDELAAAAEKWVADNAAPALQSLIDALKSTFPPPTP
jgi:hypothetical protein